MANKSDLQNAGLKVTLPRMRILSILETAPQRHLKAEDVYKILQQEGEDVGLATVYRVLTQFEQAGLVHRHRFDDDSSVFELAHDEHHDHFVCVRCGRVEEFVDPVIEAHQEAIAKQLGYRITDHNLTLYGECEQIADTGKCGKCGKTFT